MTKEKIIKAAQKLKYKHEFNRENQYLFRLTNIYGVVDEYREHLVNKPMVCNRKSKFTKKIILETAQKYKYKSAYNSALQRGWLK